MCEWCCGIGWAIDLQCIAVLYCSARWRFVAFRCDCEATSLRLGGESWLLRCRPIAHRGLSIYDLVLEMWMHVAIYIIEVLRHVLSLKQALSGCQHGGCDEFCRVSVTAMLQRTGAIEMYVVFLQG